MRLGRAKDAHGGEAGGAGRQVLRWPRYGGAVDPGGKPALRSLGLSEDQARLLYARSARGIDSGMAQDRAPELRPHRTGDTADLPESPKPVAEAARQEE